jgi:hypothetical protein
MTHPPIPPIRVLAALDLSPQGLRDRLLRGPAGDPLHFYAAPPDLSDVDEETLLKGLARWRNGLETRWAEDDDSPPAHIRRNSEALLDELRGQVRRELDGLLQHDPCGYQQALGFLDELHQELSGARAQLAADDGPFLKKAIPSVDQSFQKLGAHINLPKYDDSRLFEIIMGSFFWLYWMFLQYYLDHDPYWYIWTLGWLAFIISTIFWKPLWRSRRYQRKLAQRQADFIAAVQLKFESMQERQMRARRRDILNELTQSVRQERQALLSR